MHRAAEENSPQPNVSLLERTLQTNQLRVLSESCTALIRDALTSTVEITDLQCETPSGMLYMIPGVDKAWIEEKQQNNELVSGVTQIDLPPNTMIDEATQTLILNSEPILRAPTIGLARPRNRAIGTRTVLVVRVEATDAATSMSEAELASDIFGDGDDPNNLLSQYSACSFGKLTLTKTSDRTGISTNIQNGVVTLQIDLSVSVGESVMLNAINTELITQFSTSGAIQLANHVMICLPPGVMLPATRIGFAQYNGYRSVFNDIRCRDATAQMHEIGHNLNLRHSRKGNETYGDKSGLMGKSYFRDDGPHMCFNAAKSWQTGWYSDKAITVRPTPGGYHQSTVELAGIADYGVTNKNVLMKIEQEQSPVAYFVNYNLGKGINRGTQMGKDKVLVTKKDTTRAGNVSELIAIIDLGEHLQISNFNDRAGEELTVTWESLSNDVATIHVELTLPSQMPSMSPSVSSSVGPSHLPSQTPSMLSSVSPTDSPSHLPSQTPSMLNKPSVFPSEATFLEPSQTPSMLSSVSPTDSPSHLPSQTPSMLNKPSVFPSEATFLELETRMTLQIPGNVGSSTILKICDALEGHLDTKMKAVYGHLTQTSVECRPVDPPQDVNVVTTTFFPQRSVAPFQADFDSFVFNAVASDELNFLPEGYIMESDDSSYPPILRLAASATSSAMATPTIPGYIISSSAALSVLFLLL